MVSWCFLYRFFPLLGETACLIPPDLHKCVANRIDTATPFRNL